MLVRIAEKASRLAGIKIYQREVERVLGALLKSAEFWQVVSFSRLPVGAVVEIIRELINNGLVAPDNGALHLTPRGKKEVQARAIVPPEIRICPECAGRGLAFDAHRELLARFQEMVQQRPDARGEYDQGYVTPETTVARVILLTAKGDLQNKDLIILGDDDLVSVAAALSGLPRRVVVVEIDPRLISFVRSLAAAHNLKIEVYQQDIRKRLPAELCQQFDTFLTDPPETIPALELFLTRGLAALKGPACAGYFGLTYAESSLDHWLTFQQILTTKLKVVVTDIIHNFNEYVNWAYLLDTVRKDLSFVQVKPRLNWYYSSLCRIETRENFYRDNRDREELNLYPE